MLRYVDSVGDIDDLLSQVSEAVDDGVEAEVFGGEHGYLFDADAAYGVAVE